MANEYVKLWLSYEAYFQPLGDAEVGRLVLGMLKYKSTGVEPEFSGSERYVWPAIKRDMDEARAAQERFNEKQRDNGKKGGRPPKTQAFSEKPTETQKTQAFSEKPKKAKDKGQGTKDKGQGTNNPPLSPQGEPGAARPAKFSAKACIEQYTQDAELRQLLLDWLEVRKKARAPETERAISENLRILPQMAQESGLTLQDYMREVIRRGWRAFYPVHSEQRRNDGRDFDWLTGQ